MKFKNPLAPSQRKVIKMKTAIGKSWNTAVRALSASLTLGLVAAAANGQSAEAPGKVMQEWAVPDKPGDGKASVVIPDGNDPMGCRLEVSVKGGDNCSKVMCKGEAPVFTSSVQSKMAAKKIAMSTAKAHSVHFLQEEINSKRATDMINSAIQKEGGPDAGTQAVSGYVNAESIREQASALIKGFSVIEDGFYLLDGKQVAYAVGGVSCLSQRAADNLSSGNKTNTATTGVGAKPTTGANDPGTAQEAPVKRRAGAEAM